MADLVGITSVKEFTYRGQSEEWSNHYSLTGAVPTSGADWRTLMLLLANLEKHCYSASCSIVRLYGYAEPIAAGVNAVAVEDLAAQQDTIPGTFAPGETAERNPGDAAAWVRWWTGRLNSIGKKIYLRKYFHDVWSDNAYAPDLLDTAQKAALEAFGQQLVDGFGPDDRKIRSVDGGDTITGATASTYITTRTLKRRGKRPGS